MPRQGQNENNDQRYAVDAPSRHSTHSSACRKRCAGSRCREATRASVRRELLDYLGAAIAGRAAAGLPRWLKVLIDMGGRPDARVIGGPRVPAPTAALCNGYYGHVLEFDDTHDEAVLHAGSAAIPAAFAAAGLRGNVSGKELCEAVLLGVELTCRLGVATKLNLVEGGWIYTALFGHFGATLAAARLIDPRPEVLRNALGIVYCLASGNHQSTREGAPTKHVQPGFAAANAITAALMASGGLPGVKHPLTGEDGLEPRLSARSFRSRARDTRPRHGMGIRPPLDQALSDVPPHASSDQRGARAPRAAWPRRGEDRARGARDGAAGARRRRPRSSGEAHAADARQRAVQRVLGRCERACLRRSDAAASSPKKFRRHRSCSEWIGKISGTPDPAAAARDIGGCKIRAHGPFGTREVEHTNAKGHPDFPFSDDELLAKFKANLRYAKVSEAQAAELADAIMDDRQPVRRAAARGRSRRRGRMT